MANGMDRIEDRIQAIADPFTCFICMRLAANPRQCYYCGKLACLICFQTWLNKNYLCPHCRKEIQIQQLKNFGWHTDIVDNLKALQSIEKCSVHSKILNLYCSDCQGSICHNCVVLGEKHYGHALNPLEDVYLQHVKKIKPEIDRLKEKLNNLLQDMAKNKEHGNSLKSQGDKPLREGYETIVKRYNKKLNEELERFIRQESALDVAGIQKILQKSEEQLENSGESFFISTSSSISQDLQEVKNKLENFVPPTAIDCPSEIEPEFEYITFVVKNFTQVLQNGERVYSEALRCDGQAWKMAVSPNVSNCSKGKGYFGVVVQLCDTIFPNVLTDIEIVVQMPHCSSLEKNVFERRTITCGPETKEIAIDNFYKIDSLSIDGFLDPKTDTLKFEFAIRPPTFFERSKKQDLIIDHLLMEQSIKDDKIEELEKKLKIQGANDETNSSTETVQPSEKTDMSELKGQNSMSNNNDNEVAGKTPEENTMELVHSDTCDPTITNSRKRINAVPLDSETTTEIKIPKN